MKTFKEYRASKKTTFFPWSGDFREFRDHVTTPQEKKVIDTGIGMHSRKPRNTKIIDTAIGQHSLSPMDKQRLNEEVDHEGMSPYFRTGKEHREIHENIAPFNEEKATEHELAGVIDYSDDSYVLNKSLLNHHKTGRPIRAEVRAQAAHLDNILNKHATNKETVLYTGVKTSPSEHFDLDASGNIPKSVVVHHPAFTSTSTSPIVAANFAREVHHENDSDHGIVHTDYTVNGNQVAKHILRLVVPAGTHAMSLRDHSMLPSEKEVLVHRGHDFEISSNPVHVGNNIHMWDARIVSHIPEDLS